MQLLQLNLLRYILPRFNIISRENIIEIPLTSKKCHLAKFCVVDAWSQALLFTGGTSFSSRFSIRRFPRKSKNQLNTIFFIGTLKFVGQTRICLRQHRIQAKHMLVICLYHVSRLFFKDFAKIFQLVFIVFWKVTAIKQLSQQTSVGLEDVFNTSSA